MRKGPLVGPTGTISSFTSLTRLATFNTTKMDVWDLSGPEPKKVVTLTQPENQPYVGGLRLSAAGDRGVCWGGAAFEVWELDGEKSRRIDVSKPSGFLTDTPVSALLTPDGRTIVTGYANGAVRFWRRANHYGQ